jgi:hypothetical protein
VDVGKPCGKDIFFISGSAKELVGIKRQLSDRLANRYRRTICPCLLANRICLKSAVAKENHQNMILVFFRKKHLKTNDLALSAAKHESIFAALIVNQIAYPLCQNIPLFS